MKLKRAWPAILIWVVFVIFDIVMVASYSFFLGLFPETNTLVYSAVFTVIAILIMSVAMILLGKLSDFLGRYEFEKNSRIRIMYGVLIALIIAGGFWYRVDMLGRSAGDVVGQYSLYENAMIGGKSLTPESVLLSIIYSGILKGILFFTGNIISVPFYFQIFCFIIFLICGFFTTYKLLGMLAALVFTAYVAFMPVFTIDFTGLELSTDSLFMAMYGIELLLVATFLHGAYRDKYKSKLWIIWYILIGLVIGFMTYIDAGTIIMILPLLLSVALFDKKPTNEIVGLLIILGSTILGFMVMIIQESGIGMMGSTLVKWRSYYFHNMNTFSTFWTYTDYKMIYLVTVVVMSGVIVGFWKNKKIENVSPWLLSMLFIFATVPCMGPTRMNTQVFVTVYYAFILACVASLITLSSNDKVALGLEDAEEQGDGKEPSEETNAKAEEKAVVEEISEAETTAQATDGTREETKEAEVESDKDTADEPVNETEQPVEDSEKPVDETEQPMGESEHGEKEPEQTDDVEDDEEEHLFKEPINQEISFYEFELDDDIEDEYEESDETETVEESEEEFTEEPEENEIEEVAETTEPAEVSEETEEPVEEAAETAERADVSEETEEPVEEAEETTEKADVSEEIEESSDEPEEAEEETKRESEPQRQRFVPEGMVLPEDDEEMDQTPRMKMPEFKGGKIMLSRKGDKPEDEKPSESDERPVNEQLPENREQPEDKESSEGSTKPIRSFDQIVTRDDFDLSYKPGDDFDV